MDRIEFESAIAEMAAQFAKRGSSMATLGSFLQFCRSIARRIPEDGGVADVVFAARSYVDALGKAGASSARMSESRRHLRYIESYLDGGSIDFSHAKRVTRSSIGGSFDSDLEAYIAGMRGRGLRDATMVKWTGYAYRFMSHLHDLGLRSLSSLRISDVDEFVRWVAGFHAASGMAGELSMLRSLLAFTDASNITDGACGWVPRGRNVGSVPVAPFTDGEVASMIAAIDNTTPMGKRDLAIIMLAARTGIRSSEIVALRLPDIDWSEPAITVRRPKTSTMDVLPIDDHLASALADYVLNGRPDSPNDEIFLVHHAPYVPFSRGCSLHGISKKYCSAAGVKGRAGLHRMRHTAATDMLREGVAPDAIAAVLGHAKVENAIAYAFIEAEGLRACCLSLPEVPR